MAMNFKSLAALFAISVALTGCNTESTESESALKTSSPIVSGESSAPEINIADIPIHAADSPSEADCKIGFSADKVSVSGNGVSVSGTSVTITEGGIYAISGECTDGKIIVDAPKRKSDSC